MTFAFVLLAAAAPSGAQVPLPEAVRFDVRCLVAAAQLRQSPNAEIRAAGTGASFFYFGRVDARVPQNELEARLLAESEAMQRLDRAALNRDCGRFMQERGQMLSAVGNAITAREEAARTR